MNAQSAFYAAEEGYVASYSAYHAHFHDMPKNVLHNFLDRQWTLIYFFSKMGCNNDSKNS